MSDRPRVANFGIPREPKVPLSAKERLIFKWFDVIVEVTSPVYDNIPCLRWDRRNRALGSIEMRTR